MWYDRVTNDEGNPIVRYSNGMRKIFLLVLGVVFLVASQPRAQNDPCYDCHKDDDLIEPTGDDPYPWTFSWDRYAAGLHSDFECDDCHEAATPDGFDVVPHKIKHSATLTCADCHGSKIARIEAQFERSVHASAGDGSFRCVYCHDPHAPPPFELNLSVRDHVEFTNGICINCHANAARYRAVTGRDDLPPSLYESHAWLPRAGTHARIVLCVCCHTPVDHEGSHEILPKSRAQRKCESCHHQNSPVARKFLGEPDRTTWITHEVWFGDAYVKGAMRHRLVDGILLALAAFVILAALGHGVLLWISRRRRDSLPFVVESSPVYDGWVRSWHWGNAALFIVLLVTGFRIHFGGREEPLLSFETAFYTHNLAGAALVLWFVWFLVIGYLTGNAGSYWKAPRPWIAGMFRQARYYLYGIFKGEPHPFHPDRKRRFNPLQQLIYLAVMYLFFPILVITGVVLLYPEWLPETIAGEKAGWVIATAHYLVGWALTLFLIVHIYLCTLGDRFSYNFRGMVDGLHRSHRVIEPEEDAPAEDAVEPPESSPEDKEPSPPPSPE